MFWLIKRFCIILNTDMPQNVPAGKNMPGVTVVSSLYIISKSRFTVMELSDALKDIFDKDRILDGDLWREVYARDASYFRIPPKRSEEHTSELQSPS